MNKIMVCLCFVIASSTSFADTQNVNTTANIRFTIGGKTYSGTSNVSIHVGPSSDTLYSSATFTNIGALNLVGVGDSYTVSCPSGYYLPQGSETNLYVTNPLGAADESRAVVINDTGAVVDAMEAYVNAPQGGTPTYSRYDKRYRRDEEWRVLQYFPASGGDNAHFSIQCFPTEVAQIIKVRIV
jgi:hypothetical protein